MTSISDISFWSTVGDLNSVNEKDPYPDYSCDDSATAFTSSFTQSNVSLSICLVDKAEFDSSWNRSQEPQLDRFRELPRPESLPGSPNDCIFGENPVLDMDFYDIVNPRPTSQSLEAPPAAIESQPLSASNCASIFVSSLPSMEDDPQVSSSSAVVLSSPSLPPSPCSSSSSSSSVIVSDDIVTEQTKAPLPFFKQHPAAVKYGRTKRASSNPMKVEERKKNERGSQPSAQTPNRLGAYAHMCRNPHAYVKCVSSNAVTVRIPFSDDQLIHCAMAPSKEPRKIDTIFRWYTDGCPEGLAVFNKRFKVKKETVAVDRTIELPQPVIQLINRMFGNDLLSNSEQIKAFLADYFVCLQRKSLDQSTICRLWKSFSASSSSESAPDPWTEIWQCILKSETSEFVRKFRSV